MRPGSCPPACADEERMTLAGYRQLFEKSRDIMLVCDAATLVVLAANEAARRAYGYSARDFGAVTLREIEPAVKTDPAVPDGVRRARHRAKAGREFPVEVVEQRLEWGGRAARWLTVTPLPENELAADAELSDTPFSSARAGGTQDIGAVNAGCVLVDSTAQKTAAYGLEEHITERTQIDAALAASELRFRSLIENVPNVAVQAFDKERRVIFWNSASERLYGYTRAEALGRRLEDIAVPPESRERVVAALEAFIDHDQPFRTDEIELVRKDGRRISVYFSILKLCGANGEPEIHCIQVDITARKEAEQRIREQAALLDVAQDAILVATLDGTVTYWNRGAEIMYGIPAAEACGRRFENLVYREVPAEFGQNWNTLLKTGEWDGENKHVSRTGRVLEVRGRGKMMRSASGEPSAVLLIVSDVTESKRLEAQYLRAQRLESVGALASGIAHDLNNVLTPILMSVELLRPLARSSHDSEMLQLLSDSARRGSDIVQQLLLFGRGTDSPRSLLSVAAVIRDLGRMIRETFPRNLTISVQAPADLRLVQADRTQLEQVVLNLCVNARDAMPEGGKLSVVAENVNVEPTFAAAHGGRKAGAHVRIEVKDTGGGIPPELLDKIFDPFFTTKPVGEGTGLGLATAVGIVRSHEGFIDVQSEPGRGSVFGVFLPAAPTSAEAGVESPAGEELKGAGELVLVIEDEEGIRTVLQRALEVANYRVMTACDGAEGVGVFARNAASIALVITDVMMPVMGGAQAVPMMRQLNPQLPVIAISGLERAHRADMEKVQGPPVRFLPKPFSVDLALSEVWHSLNKAR